MRIIFRTFILVAVTIGLFSLATSAGAVTAKPGHSELKVKPGQNVTVPLIAADTSSCTARIGKLKVVTDMSDSTRITYSFKVQKDAQAKLYKLVVKCTDMKEITLRITVKPSGKKAGKGKLTKQIKTQVGYVDSDVSDDETDDSAPQTPQTPGISPTPIPANTKPTDDAENPSEDVCENFDDASADDVNEDEGDGSSADDGEDDETGEEIICPQDQI